MRSTERRRQIVDLLHSSRMHVDDLSAYFGVSVATIRRDLTSLSNEGLIARTYGGARLETFPVEPSLAQRSQLNQVQKAAIARAAARVVAAGQTVILDSGSTVAALARRIREIPDLTVVTNSIAAMEQVLSADNVQLVLLGGQLRRQSHAFVGAAAEQAMRNVTADAAFIGADGHLHGKGICERDEAQLTLKQRMMDAAAEVYLLLDSSKLDIRPASRWLEITRPHHIVTDPDITPEYANRLRKDPLVTLDIADMPLSITPQEEAAT